MQLTVDRVKLLDELTYMLGTVDQRTTIPVLSHVHLSTNTSRLKIAATNLETSLVSSCDAEVDQNGAVCVLAKKLVEILRAASGELVSFKVNDKLEMTIRAGKARFRVRCLPPEDFPDLANLGEVEPISMPFDILHSSINKVFHSISTEESKFQLVGALLDICDRRLLMASTDGHRLTLVESKEIVPHGADVDRLLVPRKALQELLRFKISGEVSIRATPHHISFAVGCRELITRILEGTFPDYERVVANDHPKRVVVDRDVLTSMVNRVAVMTGDRSRVVRFELSPGCLRFSAANPDLGEAKDEIAIDFDDHDVTLGVNPDYLMQWLTVCETPRVELRLKDRDSQMICVPVDGSDHRHVGLIMPIRL